MSLLILLINKLKPCIDFKILPVFVELNTDFSIIVSPQGLISLMLAKYPAALNLERVILLNVAKESGVSITSSLPIKNVFTNLSERKIFRISLQFVTVVKA